MRQRIYTDGACTSDNFGGWAAIFYTHKGTIIYSGYKKNTTNNRMELQLLVRGMA